jgi:hypothetical protein
MNGESILKKMQCAIFAALRVKICSHIHIHSKVSGQIIRQENNAPAGTNTSKRSTHITESIETQH